MLRTLCSHSLHPPLFSHTYTHRRQRWTYFFLWFSKKREPRKQIQYSWTFATSIKVVYPSRVLGVALNLQLDFKVQHFRRNYIFIHKYWFYGPTFLFDKLTADHTPGVTTHDSCSQQEVCTHSSKQDMIWKLTLPVNCERPSCGYSSCFLTWLTPNSERGTSRFRERTKVCEGGRQRCLIHGRKATKGCIHWHLVQFFMEDSVFISVPLDQM